MVFKQTVYSVLVASASGGFMALMADLLPMTDYWPVTVADSAAAARRLLQTADERKRRAFATARGSEKTDQLAIGDLEGEIVHRNDVFPFLSARRKFFGYVLKYYFHMRFPFIKATCIFMVLL